MHRRLGDRIDSPIFLARMPSILGRAKPWPNFPGIKELKSHLSEVNSQMFHKEEGGGAEEEPHTRRKIREIR